MPYPSSPFPENFDTNCITNFEHDSSSSSSAKNSNLNELLQWLCTTPRITSIRVNTLKCEAKDVLNFLINHFKTTKNSVLNAYIHSAMKDVIIIKHSPKTLSNSSLKEVIIDSECGGAVLRGAHIFAPGILGMLQDCYEGEKVSIYVDLARKCKKGFKKVYDESKVFIGYGIVKQNRSDMFGENVKQEGVAVEVTETISGCPQISENLFPQGNVLLQNLPSIVCVYCLDPQPNDSILDMCAAPGHKTTHIAALLQNQGTLVAIDKTPKKIERLTKHCSDFNANVHIFLGDSTKNEGAPKELLKEGPPFKLNSFDKILLDAPCSALGKRPQFRNETSQKVLNSYVPLQRKLFSMAVSLLKVGGLLVYSTCTITLGENEGIAAWALNKFQNLRLVKSKLHLGSTGMEGASLSENELKLVQRFDPQSEIDSVGFFIACFIKVENTNDSQ